MVQSHDCRNNNGRLQTRVVRDGSIDLILTAGPGASKSPDRLKTPSVSLSRSCSINGNRSIAQLLNSQVLASSGATYTLEV